MSFDFLSGSWICPRLLSLKFECSILAKTGEAIALEIQKFNFNFD